VKLKQVVYRLYVWWLTDDITTRPFEAWLAGVFFGLGLAVTYVKWIQYLF
jgi:hypothetical protein